MAHAVSTVQDTATLCSKIERVEIFYLSMQREKKKTKRADLKKTDEEGSGKKEGRVEGGARLFIVWPFAAQGVNRKFFLFPAKLNLF